MSTTDSHSELLLQNIVNLEKRTQQLKRRNKLLFEQVIEMRSERETEKHVLYSVLTGYLSNSVNNNC